MCVRVETRVPSLLHPTTAVSCVALSVHLHVRNFQTTSIPRPQLQSVDFAADRQEIDIVPIESGKLLEEDPRDVQP